MKQYMFYLLFIFCICKQGAAIDCSGRCACCIDGESSCGQSPGLGGDANCLKGCVDTIYGHKCKNACGGNCLKCSQDTGAECFACKPGFYGTSSFCAESCSIRCINGTCENDGSCTCIPNFEGNKCDTCIHGRYGDNCEHTCSIGCIGETCNRNGSCSCLHNFSGQNCDACAANYEGSACDSCDDGFYGNYCSKSCILVDSSCLQCKRHDEYCMKCENGFFPSNGNCVKCGINCLERKCDPTNGRCTLGCKAGFWSDICDANCNLNCSSCDQLSSVCLQCTTDVVYGPFCNMSCNSSCADSSCHSVTGKCTHGCIFNRHGSYCENKCSDNCEQNNGESPCNSSGVCINGCVGGYIGTSCITDGRIYITSSTNTALTALVGLFATLFVCTAAGCYLWNRRRSKPKEHNSEIQLDTPVTERAYEQLQRQTSDPTYVWNVDDNYTVLPM